MSDYIFGLITGFLSVILIAPAQVKYLVGHYQDKTEPSSEPRQVARSETVCFCNHGKNTHFAGKGSCNVFIQPKAGVHKGGSCACLNFVGRELEPST